MTTIIRRNSTIPKKETEIFTTNRDNQTSISIQVLEGEGDKNNVLGTFELTNIPPAPKGQPQIGVTFDIDRNGIMNVSAKDMNTGRENKITITNDSGRLSAEDIEHMVHRALVYKAEDDREKERVSAMNALESYAFSVKSAMEDGKSTDNVLEGNRIKAIGKCEEVIKWLDSNQTAKKDEFECQMEKLMEMMKKFHCL